MKGHIVELGSINTDLVVRTPRLPLPGETLLARSFDTFAGGKGANQAVAIARMGAQTVMVGRVGNDVFAQARLNDLTRDGVDTTFIGRDDSAPTGVALIQVDDRGENTILVVSGANMKITPQDVEAAEQVFQDAFAMVTQFEVPIPVVQKGFELCRKHGVRIILNPAPAQALGAEFFAQADDLVPNQGELALITGTASLDEGVQRMHKLGVKRVLVTLGAEGVLLSENGEQSHIPSFNVKAVDATAAGDGFVGAYAAALADGKPVKEAIRWASAAAAISVTRYGAQPSLARRGEVEEFLGKYQA